MTWRIAVDNPFEPVLLIEEAGPVRIVTMNRPEALNANSHELHEALVSVWRHVASDPQARAVVLTGAGRAFSAGGDVRDFVSMWTDRALRRAMIDEGRDLALAMIDFPLPLVAAVNGPAVGLGCSLALACDLVVMAQDAYLSDPHVSVGLTAGDGGAFAWPLLMSMPRAKEYLLTGDPIPAEVALSIGLANRVTPQAGVLAEAVALAGRLAAQPPQALRTTKRALNMHLRRAAEGVLDFALESEYQSFDTDEHRAAVERFLARGR
jgi:enoyl-CoA hydratase